MLVQSPSVHWKTLQKLHIPALPCSMWDLLRQRQCSDGVRAEQGGGSWFLPATWAHTKAPLGDNSERCECPSPLLVLQGSLPDCHHPYQSRVTRHTQPGAEGSSCPG